MKPGEKVEVEAGYAHDGVVGVSLVFCGEVGEGVPFVGEVVVCGMERAKEGWASCE